MEVVLGLENLEWVEVLSGIDASTPLYLPGPMMNWKVILNIAKTHLLTKMKSTVTASLGVTFGIGAYITLVSFMTGLNGMLDSLVLNQTPHVHLYNEVLPSEKQPIDLYRGFEQAINVVSSVRPKDNQDRIHNALPIIEYLKEHPEVEGVTPQLQAQIFYLSGTTELGGNLIGVDILEEARLYNLNDYLVEGSARDLHQDDNGILLGAGLAKKMSLKVGDRVQVSTADGTLFPLKIVGFYQSGLSEIDNVRSFANIKTVQNILGQNKSYYTDINVKLHDLGKAENMATLFGNQFNLKGHRHQAGQRPVRNGDQHPEPHHLCRFDHPIDRGRLWDL